MESVIITGAAGGIGRETVKALASAERHIVCVDISDEALAPLRQIASNLAGEFSFVPSRMEDVAACRKVVADAGDQVSGLVHLAGVFEADPQAIDDMGVYERAIRHNLTNGYMVANAVMEKASKGRAGAMVFTSSLAFRRGSWEHVPYAAAKGGLVGMTRAMSRRFAPDWRVNAIAPGLINTGMPAKLIAERGLERVTREIPMKRLGEPSEVASAIAFLMGSSSSYVTGQCINIDGGIINS
ncbi:SDR family oxidoreductase [Stappia sp. GBMRC 2046]|uniref:SDR family oxidoreductase n=1 Tax=Stappia sediminis TaxID=2692190 RepID=A0A7X3LUZ9_9HYPH|nr:SDR family oxidoreductase [Stappia sediminis]MXN65592.1 SDR family oxidoreductase [Stappia sediminis]